MRTRLRAVDTVEAVPALPCRDSWLCADCFIIDSTKLNFWNHSSLWFLHKQPSTLLLCHINSLIMRGWI